MNASSAAFAAGALAVIGALDVAGGIALQTAGRASVLGGPLRAAADAFTRAGREGRDPGAAERRQLLAGGAFVAFCAGTFVFGFAAGVIAAGLAPAVASRLLRARRERYRRAVDAGAAEIAIALADALSGGHSLRGALLQAAGSLEGPAGHELKRVASQLDLGAPTDEALEGMRHRIGSPRIDVIVAGALMQRRAGGDLAKLLRGCARAFEDEARLLREVRAATAQARFTGTVVVLLPLGGAGLAELASPGFAGRLAAFPLAAWLVGMAIAMQVAAAFAIRKLARTRE
jgi:tight adherence protein B